MKNTPTTPNQNAEMADVGRVVGVFGLRGHVKITPLTDYPERFEPGESLWLEGKDVEIIDSHWSKSQVRVLFRGVGSMEQAQALIGKILKIPLDERPELEEDEFYFNELVGLDVIDQDGNPVGKVTDIQMAPAHDLLIVGDIVVPCVREFILDVDLDKGLVQVKLIPGMRPGEDE